MTDGQYSPVVRSFTTLEIALEVSAELFKWVRPTATFPVGTVDLPRGLQH